MEVPNLSDGDVISACISKDTFMKAPDESRIKKDFPEKAKEWVATAGKRCTDATIAGDSFKNVWRFSSRSTSLYFSTRFLVSFKPDFA